MIPKKGHVPLDCESGNEREMKSMKTLRRQNTKNLGHECGGKKRFKTLRSGYFIRIWSFLDQHQVWELGERNGCERGGGEASVLRCVL